MEKEQTQEIERNFEETETQGTVVERGIVLYETDDGSISMQVIGEESITLKELAYFKRYLDNLEQKEWEIRTKGGIENAPIQE